MKCPGCGSVNSDVIDSRPAEKSIRRRRKCPECKFRFTTMELNKDDLDLMKKQLEKFATFKTLLREL